jgi:formate hydrogenlyase subunit 5
VVLEGRFRAVAEEAPPGERRLRVPVAVLDRAASTLLAEDASFVSLFATGRAHRDLVVSFALRGELVSLRCSLAGGVAAYPSLSLLSPAFRLPERALLDREGLVPLGHPDLVPVLRPDADRLRRRVDGDGVFVIPYGPIRSGIFEAIQYTIETGGEDVLALEVRPFFKHRRLESRFEGLSLEHGAALAERVAGIASVAHALAFAEAIERALRVEIPQPARLWRVVHAELERMANHLDVTVRLAEDAALAVGAARFGLLKEEIMRLRARLCGSRFGRGVIVPGGLSESPLLGADELRRALGDFERDFARDRSLLVRTASFTDRLVGSGTLDRDTVDSFAGVGPVARACGLATDARFERPYAAYGRLGYRLATSDAGDAMARLDVRFVEIGQGLHLIRQALVGLGRFDGGLRVELPSAGGDAFGWVEAPMGELAYWVEVEAARVGAVRISSPSLRNWPLFEASFRGDVLTDFSFIEHSFGLTPAGADR